MKHFLRVAILVCVAALFLSAWSLPTVASGKDTLTNRQVTQGQFGFNPGAKTSLAPSANSRGSGEFRAVAAVSANDAWAVGSGLGTLIEHWNGTKWSIVTSPSPGSIGNFLNGVTAISTGDAWTVGGFSNSHFTSQTLTEHWNGSAWSVVKSPNVGTPPVSRN